MIVCACLLVSYDDDDDDDDDDDSGGCGLTACMHKTSFTAGEETQITVQKVNILFYTTLFLFYCVGYTILFYILFYTTFYFINILHHECT